MPTKKSVSVWRIFSLTIRHSCSDLISVGNSVKDLLWYRFSLTLTTKSHEQKQLIQESRIECLGCTITLLRLTSSFNYFLTCITVRSAFCWQALALIKSLHILKYEQQKILSSYDVSISFSFWNYSFLDFQHCIFLTRKVLTVFSSILSASELQIPFICYFRF